MILKLLKKLNSKTRQIKFKYWAIKCRLILKKSHLDLQLWSKPTIYYPERLSIGKHVAINDNFWANAVGSIEIGNHVLIGPSVIIHSANHKFDDLNRHIADQGHSLICFRYS